MALQLMLSSVAYASPRESAYTFGTLQPMDLASVSVVRLTATYTPTALPPPIGCSTINNTGLGVLVGSWPTTAGGSTFTNWVLTDGSFIDPNGVSCNNGQTKELLSAVQVYVNNAYTNTNATNPMLTNITCQVKTCTSNGTPASMQCQDAVTCANGVSLISFQTSSPQPYVDLANADATNPAPFGIELTSLTQTGTTITPNPAQAAQLLTPTQVLNPNLTSPTTELGMPVIDSLGHLQNMITKNTDTGGSIRGYVTTVLSPTQSGHSNSLRESWNTGVSDYYNGDSTDALTAFKNAGTHNTLFRAGVAFWSIVNAKVNGSSGAGSGGSTTPVASHTPAVHGTSARVGNNVNLLGVSIPSTIFTALIVAAIVVLVIILALITFAIVRKQMRQRREYAKLNRIATEEAARIKQQELEDQERLRAQQSVSTKSSPPVIVAPANTNQPAASMVALRCPNCGHPVKSSDSFCPNCRSPLVLSDSGLNVRLKMPVSAPIPSVAVPPSAPAAPPPGLVPSSDLSDMPTAEFPHDGMQNGTEATTPLVVRGSTPRGAASVEQFSNRNLGLIVGTRSDPGIKRQHKPNEDSLYAAEGMLNSNMQAPQFGLFVVADGMGGHANGQDASRLAIQTIVETLMPRLTGNEAFREEDFAQLLADGVQKANMAVHQRNMEYRADMGTTMTATLVVGSTAYLANVGDSRTYLYRKPDGLKKITNDHSVVASLVEAGIIQPDDIYTHPKRNQIYRSLGEKPMVDVDTFKVPLKPGDKLVLCSDGLWDMVRDPLIEQVLNTVPDPTQTRNALIQAALDGGGEDNVSVIVVHIADSPQGNILQGVQVLARPDAPQYPPM